MLNKIALILLSLSLLSCAEQLTTEQYLKSGQEYLAKNDWKAAIIEFKNSIKQSPDNATARKLLGQTYLRTYSTSAAIIELKKARDLGLSDGDLMLSLGKAYSQSQKNDELIKEITVQDKYSPSQNADIHALRALAYFAQNDEPSGISELDAAKALDDSTDDVRLAWASYERFKKNTDAQKAWLKPLLDKEGGVADAWSQMAEINKSEGKLEQAEADYSKAIKLRGLIHVDYSQRALVRISLKNYSGAQEDLSLLKKAGLQWPIIGHAEGLIDYLQKNYDQAQSKLDQVNAKYKDYTPTQLILGLVHYQKENYQNAVNLLEQYISKVPDAYQPNIVLAASNLKLGKADTAIEILEKMQKTYPDDFRIMSILGNAYIVGKNIDKGIKTLSEAVKMKPDEAKTRLQLGTALLRGNSEIELGQQEVLKAIELDPELQQADLVLYASYIKSKKLNDARKVAAEVERKQPDSSLGPNLIALTFLVEENKGKAVDLLEGVLKKFPADPLTSNNLARIYLQDKNFSKAKTIYGAVLEKDPNNLKTLNQMAVIASMEKDQAGILSWLQKAVEGNPDQLAPKLTLASQLLKNNDAKGAVTILNAASTEQKTTPVYMLVMGRAKIAVGEYDHAIRLLKLLVAENPTSATGHFTLAQAYAATKNPERMRTELTEATNINPGFLNAQIALARLDLFERKIDAFKSRVSDLIKNYPTNPDVKFLNSKITSGDKNYDDAIKTLSEMVAQTSSPEVVIDLARNQWLKGDKASAISSLELWIEDNEAETNVLMMLAQYQLADNRVTEAESTYNKLDKLTPNNSVVLNNLAWLLKDTDPAKGSEFAERALSLDKDNPYIKDTLSALLLISNEPKKALPYASEAAKALPNYVEVQVNYARVLAANNNTNKARDVLNSILSKAKSYEHRKQINEELNKL